MILAILGVVACLALPLVMLLIWNTEDPKR
jgi:hypothetical protein